MPRSLSLILFEIIFQNYTAGIILIDDIWFHWEFLPFQKKIVHITLAILLSAPINSDSVEIYYSNFFFVELLIIAPFPTVNPTPV